MDSVFISPYIRRRGFCDALRDMHDWYMIFDTLTVLKQKNALGILIGRNQSFKGYLKSIKKSIAPAGYKVIACVERGEKGGGYHMHCLHFLEWLPAGCHILREEDGVVEAFKKFGWEHGSAYPKAFRYKDDMWTKRLGYDCSLEYKKNDLINAGIRIRKYMFKQQDTSKFDICRNRQDLLDDSKVVGYDEAKEKRESMEKQRHYAFCKALGFPKSWPPIFGMSENDLYSHPDNIHPVYLKGGPGHHLLQEFVFQEGFKRHFPTPPIDKLDKETKVIHNR